MELVKQPKTAGFRPKSRYEYIVRRLSKCYLIFCFQAITFEPEMPESQSKAQKSQILAVSNKN